jgi:hypothetical protein
LCASILWGAYGFMIDDLQIIICNIGSGFITSLIIGFGSYYKIKLDTTGTIDTTSQPSLLQVV